MSFVKNFEDMVGMMSMETHLKCVLGFRGVVDIDFYILWISDMMCRKDQYLPLVQCLAKHFKYLQPVVILWTCVLIFYATILKKFSLRGFFCDFYLSLIFTKNECFICALCGNFTAFCSLSPNKTVTNTL